MSAKSSKIVITGHNGLLGYHVRCALYAKNCAAVFVGDPPPYDIVLAPRLDSTTTEALSETLQDADCAIHLAGINRAPPNEVEAGNAEIATVLVHALRSSSSKAHVIYANSTHAKTDTPYGRGKQSAHIALSQWAADTGCRYSNFILPHIFGEYSRPFYNTVTATLCQQVSDGEEPTIGSGANVELLHAGAVADAMESAYLNADTGTQQLQGKPITVEELHKTILSYKEAYDNNTYPDLSDSFAVQLFNTYRSFEFPHSFPRALKLNNDPRGRLFEAVKGGGGGQTFLSWTKPGIERGNHFHRTKVERFLVVSGKADIKVRKLFSEETNVFSVSGESPEAVDMPTLCTHSIVNTGSEPLLTLFWAHEVFDPEHPDTYAAPVDL